MALPHLISLLNIARTSPEIKTTCLFSWFYGATLFRRIGRLIAIASLKDLATNGGSLLGCHSKTLSIEWIGIDRFPDCFCPSATKVSIHVIDPLRDRRWVELVLRHPRASVFHSRGWLEALNRTYGYEPYVLTSSPFDKPLENGVLLCRVSSWITGARLVSLPFSDHCDPLFHEQDEAEELTRWMQGASDLQNLEYMELRPLSGYYGEVPGLKPHCSYWLHELCLGPSLGQIFQRLHSNSFQRKIQRAERENLSYEAGRSERLIDEFYGLLVRTRKRQRLLPQPRAWFRNLCECLKDSLQIRLAKKDETPVAAMLTLRQGSSVVYKYGCSNERFHSLGGMPFLFWKMIQESKVAGIERIDLGRTDMGNVGLIAFKDRLGSSKKVLTYYRYSKAVKQGVATLSESPGLRRFLALMPDAICSAAGRVLYRHWG